MDSRAQKLNELRSKRAAAQAAIAERITQAAKELNPPKPPSVSNIPKPAVRHRPTHQPPRQQAMRVPVKPKPHPSSIPDRLDRTPLKMPVIDYGTPATHDPTEGSQKYGYKFFYINLDRATERRTRMEEQLTTRGIQFERVQAIDAASNPLTDFIPPGWKGNLMTTFKAEIATTLSHIKAIKQLVSSGEPAGVILEDDAIFEYEPMWPYTLKEVIDGAPEDWELLTLSITTSENRMYEGIMQAKRRYHLRKSNFYSAVAYALTRNHAIAILNRFAVPLDSNAPFQCKLNGSISQMQSEINILGTGPHRYFLYPPAFTYPTDNNSYIHPTHIQGHKNCKAVVSRAYDVKDPFYFMPTR